MNIDLSEKQKPVIVRITPVFLTVEAIFKNQNKFLVDNGFDVHVVTSSYNAANAVSKYEGFNYHAINILRGIGLFSDLKSIVSLVKLFKDIKPDIVHTHTSKGGLVGMLAAYISGVKCRVHSVAGWTVDIRNMPFRAVLVLSERITLKLATSILVNSHSLREYLISDGYLTSAKSLVLGRGSSNGVDLFKFSVDNIDCDVKADIKSKFNILQNDVVIGFVGRIMIEKGVLELIDAFMLLECDNIHLMLVGEVESKSRKSLSEQVLTMMDNDCRVHVTGWVDNVHEYLSIIDILVHPSYSEGMPNAILQASSMGVPCIATNVRGNKDVVLHKRTGLLYHRNETNALLKYLSLLIADANLRIKYGQQARRYIEDEFDHNDVCQRLLDYYVNGCSLKGL